MKRTVSGHIYEFMINSFLTQFVQFMFVIYPLTHINLYSEQKVEVGEVFFKY